MEAASGLALRRFTLIAAAGLLASGCFEVTTVPVQSDRASISASDPKPQPAPIIPPLALTPGTASLGIGRQLDFSASGGVAPYTFNSNGGLISALGKWSAPYVPGNVTVTVQDSRGVTASAAVMVTVGVNAAPNDPQFPNLANLSQATNADINAPEAWAIQSDCSSLVVGVLDTGIDFNHPDLAANVYANKNEIAGNNTDDDKNGFVDDIRGWNFVNFTNNVMDDNLHGTHVSGTIGAIGNNATGVTGICWKARIMALKFLDKDGGGVLSDAIDAIDYASANGVKVINASFGGGGFSQNFKDALDRANAAGVLFVAASGNETNDNDATPSYPASYNSANVLSVAAVTGADALANFSNFGAASVHIAAPGVDILSTFPTVVTAEMTLLKKTSFYERISGTSMATPHVVGAAALAWSFEPGLTVLGLRSRLLDRSDALAGLNGKVAGSRRLNLRKLLYAP